MAVRRSAAVVALLVGAAVSAAPASAAPGASERGGAAQFTVIELEVEHLSEPTDGVTLLGLDVQHPRFSWRLLPNSTGSRGLTQSAYRLQLFAQEPGVGDDGSVKVVLLWDTGKVREAAQPSFS